MRPHGPFVWHELVVPSPSEAKVFYNRVAGWVTQQSPGPMDYTLWINNGTSVGGLIALTSEFAAMGVKPTWFVYMAVRDVDESAKLAQSLGGRINRPPTDIPESGRFAILTDPQGGVFCLWTSAQNTPPPAAPQIGEFSWHELATTDHVSALDFYAQVFGWSTISSMDLGGGAVYQEFGQDERMYGGVYAATPARAGALPQWLSYIRVKDISLAVNAVTHGGGRVLSGPTEVPGGSQVAVCVDSQGTPFAMHQHVDD